MIKLLRNIFKRIEINPREVFFDILPGIYDGEDKYENCYIHIEQAKNEMDNFITKIISYPGMMLQKFTTNEPDDSQLEVALESLKAVLD